MRRAAKPPRQRARRISEEAATPPEQRQQGRNIYVTPDQLRRTTPDTAPHDQQVQQQVRAGYLPSMPVEIQEAIRRRAREIENERSHDRER
jgi:hypothetical protein